MTIMERYQKKTILRDLEKKMVLLAGPRQAGKTTLAKEIGELFKRSTYLNYDSLSDRKIIEKEAWLPDTDLLILDEIHKMNQWKNFLKGIYDTKPKDLKILVTGSARLEVFHEVGDSLAGRFFLHRLMPLSPAEMKKVGSSCTLENFLEKGNFPEPFLTTNIVDAKRWRLQYVDSLLRTDVLDFENINNVKAIRLLFDLLKDRVGSPISYASLAQYINISPHTVKRYINILEALYIVFRVTPYSNNIARSLLKEPKIYFFDTGLVKNDIGIQFENFVAVCLLKHVLSKIDYLAEEYSLNYLRTKNNQEVDFAIVNDKKIEKIIEVKMSDHNLSKGLLYFKEKYNFPALQIVKHLKKEKNEAGVKVLDGLKFLESLDL